MGLERASLVRRIRQRLDAPWACGEDRASLEQSLAELNRRVRRLHRLGDQFSAVQVSGHIAGLRAALVPDRAEGVASPGMV